MLTKNPLNPNKRIRVNDNYDQQDVIIQNNEDHEFTDMPRSDQLTQNNWNFSPYTRKGVYRDVTGTKLVPITRMSRYKGTIDPRDYHRPR